LFDFDTEYDFQDTLSKKWNFREELGGCRDAIPMWIADMDFKTAPAIIEAIERRAAAGIYGYAGIPREYIDAVIGWYKAEHDWTIQPASIVSITGIVPALHVAAAAFTQAGESILLQTPVYHPFYRVAKKMHRSIVENPMRREENSYEIDFADLEHKLKTERPKLMFLCNPQNPVGKTFSKEELTRIGQLCLEHGVITIVDEIHSDIVYSDACHIPYGTLAPELVKNAVICTAPSKTFNIAGLRNSNIVIPSPKLRKVFVEAKEYFGYPGVGPFPLIACEAAYREGKKWKDAAIRYIEENRDEAVAFFKQDLPEVVVHKPQGTYFLWLDFRQLGLDKEELEQFLLHKAKVWLNQGYIFGHEGEGFARMNIACPRSLLRQALHQIKTAVEEKLKK
jgi:cysteine-S-conjugate beta-lyase